MTPRIPRGWVVATERGEGVWCDYVGNGWRRAMERGPLLPERTYIVRTDPSVPADPNECLRIEDEAARLVDERKPDDALPMVPGMMLIRCASHPFCAPLDGFTFGIGPDGTTNVCEVGQGSDVPFRDSRTPADFAAAYTAAWEYTERRRAEIAEEVRRGGAPTTENTPKWADIAPLLAELATLRERTRRRDAVEEPPPEGVWVLGRLVFTFALAAMRPERNMAVRYIGGAWVDEDDNRREIVEWWPLPEVTNG